MELAYVCQIHVQRAILKGGLVRCALFRRDVVVVAFACAASCRRTRGQNRQKPKLTLATCMQ
eukprot:4419360-Amphidinium_carterae.1